jgi:hypothetical protein
MTGPYRESRPIARYLCIVCYKSMSAYAGPCRTCGVPRLDLSEPAVREQVRLEGERRLQQSIFREYSALSLPSVVLLSPALWWLGAAAFALVLPLTVLSARVYSALHPKSAIATLAARQRRTSAELGVDIRVDNSSDSSLDDDTRQPDLDPLQLEMEPLLAWLGAKLDD